MGVTNILKTRTKAFAPLILFALMTGCKVSKESAAQAATGNTAYDANCAVCHGNTMTNGTFAAPLAGEYFKTQWAGKTVGDFLTRPRRCRRRLEPDLLLLLKEKRCRSTLAGAFL